MRSANLLVETASFAFDLNTDKSQELSGFLDACGLANEVGDLICCEKTAFYEQISDTVCLYDWTEVNSHLSWMTIALHQSLTDALLYRSPKEIEAKNISELDSLHPEENNGILLIFNDQTDVDRVVYNKPTWYGLHRAYLVNNPSYIAWDREVFLPNINAAKQIIIEAVESLGLPFSNYSDEDKIKHFNNEHIRFLRGNDHAAAINLCEQILMANYYVHNQSLSSEEQQRRRGSTRRIYEIEKNGKKQYASIDHENINIEMANANGKHLGAINFIGELKSGPDSSGSHDIWSLR